MIVSVILDDNAKSRFTALRKEFFPPAINYLDAHLTLFHNIPDEIWIREALAECSMCSLFEMEVGSPLHTGFGVAYKIYSPELVKLHENLRQKFREVLIPQDQQKFRPHITIQNKVTPEASKALFQALSRDFVSSNIFALGLSTFEYLNGPWKHIGDYKFQSGL